MGCRFDPHWSYRGLECLRVENEHIAVEVLPELGAKIFRFIDKARDHDFLWHSPRVAPMSPPSTPTSTTTGPAVGTRCFRAASRR